MYKVFVNEKELFLSKSPKDYEKVFTYEGTETIEMGIDLLQNTSCNSLNIYFEDVEKMWNDFKKSSIVIEAAGGIVRNEEQEILFIKRLDKWDLPKGKIEIGESREIASLREVEEETAIKNLKLIDFLTSTYHIYVDRNQQNILKITHWFSMRHQGKEIAIPQIEEGITEVSWKTDEEILAEVYPSTFKNIKMILQNLNIGK